MINSFLRLMSAACSTSGFKQHPCHQDGAILTADFWYRRAYVDRGRCAAQSRGAIAARCGGGAQQTQPASGLPSVALTELSTQAVSIGSVTKPRNYITR